MEQENDFLKKNISRVLDTFTESELINWGDEYQGMILQREAAMNLLKQDIFNQETLIDSCRQKSSKGVFSKIVSKQKEIRSKIYYIEKEFHILKNLFISDFERITSF